MKCLALTFFFILLYSFVVFFICSFFLFHIYGNLFKFFNGVLCVGVIE